jgi:hypothetical protein
LSTDEVSEQEADKYEIEGVLVKLIGDDVVASDFEVRPR